VSRFDIKFGYFEKLKFKAHWLVIHTPRSILLCSSLTMLGKTETLYKIEPYFGNAKKDGPQE